jgi:hypothetical protein
LFGCELLDDCVHGGTIRVVMLALFGSTSWFGCDDPLLEDELELLLCEPELCCEVPAPPGVIRIVLEGGGVEPPPEDPPWHG